MDSCPPIAFDISFLPASGGFATYTQEILQHIIEIDSARSYLLIENELPLEIPQYANREENRKNRMPSLPSSWQSLRTHRRSRVAWMVWDLPRLLRDQHSQLFYSIDNVTVPPRNSKYKTIITIHDLIPLTHPRYCRFRDAFAAQWLIRRALRLADSIITISHYSARQIIKYDPSLQNKIHVIESGVNHQFFHPISDRGTLAEQIAKVHHFYSPRFILNVSTLNPRKNLIRLLQAYHQHLTATNDRETCLVIAGCRGWNYGSIFRTVQELHLQHRVHFMDFVPDLELLKLYQSAFLFVMPSLLEGFGLPVIEAMACGTPVICSQTTALGEISQDAAIQFDPSRVESIAQAITTMTQDESLQHEFSQKGILHTRKFRWEDTTRQIIELFNTML